MSETPAEYNAKIIAEFRAHKGRVGGMWEGTPLLLLHHTGAKSGVSRVNPVAYLPDDRRYLIWAANGGAPNNPDWYHNLKAHPNPRVEVGSQTIDVVAEEATGAERERLFERAAERYPQLSELARKTNRVIPVLILTPHGDRVRPPEIGVSDQTEAPVVVDRPTFQADLDALRAREKAHTRAGDAIAAARRRLPMVEVDADLTLVGPQGPVTLLDAFEGRTQLIAYYHMWYAGTARCGAVRRLHILQRAGPRAVLSALPRRHLRHVLPGPVRGERPLPRLHGLDHALVFGRGFRRGSARGAQGEQVLPGVLPAAGRPRVRDLLDQRPRGRGDGQQLRPLGPDRLRAATDVGGLARRMATTSRADA